MNHTLHNAHDLPWLKKTMNQVKPTIGMALLTRQEGAHGTGMRPCVAQLYEGSSHYLHDKTHQVIVCK